MKLFVFIKFNFIKMVFYSFLFFFFEWMFCCCCFVYNLYTFNEKSTRNTQNFSFSFFKVWKLYFQQSSRDFIHLHCFKYKSHRHCDHTVMKWQIQYFIAGRICLRAYHWISGYESYLNICTKMRCRCVQGNKKRKRKYIFFYFSWYFMMMLFILCFYFGWESFVFQ